MKALITLDTYEDGTVIGEKLPPLTKSELGRLTL